jgi:hypothetical protein
MVEPLITFRRRRQMASFGMLALGLCVVAALVVRFFPPLSPWFFVALGIVLAAVGAWQYRCPFCNHFPEADVPSYDPEACSHCGERLR